MKDLDKYDKLLNHSEDPVGDDELSQFLQKSSAAGIPEGRGKKAIWEAIEEELDKEESGKDRGKVKINP